MSNTLLLYATISGNSSMLAMGMQEKLEAKQQDHKFEIMDVMDADDLDYKKYDLVIFLCSTWDDGQPNANAREYLADLKKSDVAGQKFAILGLGDSAYPKFCGAVPIIDKRLRELGAEIVGQPFKVDGIIEDEVIDKATAWASKLI